jgi:hypothetical protein
MAYVVVTKLCNEKDYKVFARNTDARAPNAPRHDRQCKLLV